MNEHPRSFEVPRHWTPEQALDVFEWLHSLAYALWDAYDDEILDTLETRQVVDDRQIDLPF